MARQTNYIPGLFLQLSSVILGLDLQVSYKDKIQKIIAVYSSSEVAFSRTRSDSDFSKAQNSSPNPVRNSWTWSDSDLVGLIPDLI